MKKTYETPSIEVVKFQYRDQVVAASMPQALNYDPSDIGECTHREEQVKP